MRYIRFEQDGMAAIKRTETETMCIPNDSLNRHYIEYQSWLADGNTPDDMLVIEPSNVEPSIDERLEATELMLSMLMDEET